MLMTLGCCDSLSSTALFGGRNGTVWNTAALDGPNVCSAPTPSLKVAHSAFR